MKTLLKYTWKDFNTQARLVLDELSRFGRTYSGIYGVPRGGQVFATFLSTQMNLPMVSKDKIITTTLIVDDILDSGTTRKRFSENNDFVCLHCAHKENLIYLFNKNSVELTDKWVIYPWEEEEGKSVDDSILRFFQFIGEDPNREGLIDTPKRVIKSWKELYSGYQTDISQIITTFDEPGNKYDQLILLKNIELFSMCEHHILPFIGKAHIAYIPDGKVIGISKLARIMEVFARRLQIQERLGDQITSVLIDQLRPKGAACIIEAQHLCMRMRGVSKQNSTMITSSLKGIFLEDDDRGRSARKELMDLIK